MKFIVENKKFIFVLLIIFFMCVSCKYDNVSNNIDIPAPVTKEDIIKVSKKVKIDTIYLLSGGDGFEKN